MATLASRLHHAMDAHTQVGRETGSGAEREMCREERGRKGERQREGDREGDREGEREREGGETGACVDLPHPVSPGRMKPLCTSCWPRNGHGQTHIVGVRKTKVVQVKRTAWGTRHLWHAAGLKPRLFQCSARGYTALQNNPSALLYSQVCHSAANKPGTLTCS